MIYIAGLGAGDVQQLPLGVAKFLKGGLPIYLRTKEHPMLSYFEDNKIPYTSFDSIYEENDGFSDVYENIILKLIEKHTEGDLIYCVPGHPCVAEYTVTQLLKRVKDTKIIGGQSFLDAMFAALKIDPIEGLQIMDALDFRTDEINIYSHLFIPQVYDQLVASDLKLDLMDKYDDEHQICIVGMAGSAKENLHWCPLYELDIDFKIDNLITIYVPPIKR